MKKIFFLISIFAMMPLMGEQSQESIWKKYTPTFVTSFKKAVMHPFAGIKVAINESNPLSFSKMGEFIKQRNPFIAGLAKYAPMVKAEECKVQDDYERSKRLAIVMYYAALNNKLYNAIQENDVYEFERALENGADLAKASDYLMKEKIECSTFLDRYWYKKSHCDALDQMDKILVKVHNNQIQN